MRLTDVDTISFGSTSVSLCCCLRWCSCILVSPLSSGWILEAAMTRGLTDVDTRNCYISRFPQGSLRAFTYVLFMHVGASLNLQVGRLLFRVIFRGSRVFSYVWACHVLHACWRVMLILATRKPHLKLLPAVVHEKRYGSCLQMLCGDSRGCERHFLVAAS